MKKTYKTFQFAVLFFAVIFSRPLQSQNCTGTPASNTAVVSATSVCVGASLTFSLANTYTATGIVYQWVYSTFSASGPWNPVNGANGSILTTNTLTVSGYYTAVIGCTSSFQTNTATAVYVNINAAGATITVPYFEGFEVSGNNILPNCSWAASSLGTNCQTFITGSLPRSGIGLATFAFNTTGTHSYYSMGLQLTAGVVYSTSIWHTTNTFAPQNTWSNFSLTFNTAQSAPASTTIASLSAPATGPYASLSGTFVVPSTGIYYIGINATSAVGTNTAQYLLLDDFSVVIPCTPSATPNIPTITVTPSVVCSGVPVTFTALGASSYTWSDGTSGTVATYTPSTTNAISVMGTNSLSGCLSGVTFVLVNPSPNVFVVSSVPTTCPGETTTLTIFGGTSFSLNGQPLSTFTVAVSPTVTTIYTAVSMVTGNSCIGSAIFTLSVMPSPTVTAVASKSNVCRGETVLLNAGGAFTFQWVGYTATSSMTFEPQNNMTFTVVGRLIGNCLDTATVDLLVSDCVSLEKRSSVSRLLISPNPNNGIFHMTDPGFAFTFSLYDMTGKLVRTYEGSGDMEIDIRAEPDGIYFAAFNSSTEAKVIKVVKQSQ